MKPGNEIKMRIVLQAPPTGVLFGLQKGKGNDYETVQKQTFVKQDLLFEFPATLRIDNGQVDFAGPFVQGPRDGRFIYLDIGTAAGQIGAAWSRRLKVPLTGITIQLTNELSKDSQLLLQAQVPGTAKDGTPTCATVKNFTGWKLTSR
jgi:hypothetical protein